jgi:hypothetical protein
LPSDRHTVEVAPEVVQVCAAGSAWATGARAIAAADAAKSIDRRIGLLMVAVLLCQPTQFE